MPKRIWQLVIATAISVTGASFLWPLNTIYMHNELGKSLTFAGIILMLNQGATIVGNIIGGILFDRYSAYKTLLYGTLITFTAAAGLSFFHTILPYSIFLIMIGFGSGVTWPAMYAMAGSVWPEGGRRAFNAVYVAQNFGVALGATIGGYVASISFNLIFVSNALLIGIYFMIILFGFKWMDDVHNRQVQTTIIQQGRKVQDRTAFNALIVLSIGFFAVWLAYSQWQATIASHTQDIGIPLEKYSALWAINGFLIVLGQPLVKWFTDRVTSLKAHIYVGNLIFLSSFVIAMVAEQFTIFAVAMVILTLGEMLMWPAIPSLANDLAPAGRAGFYQGFINSVASAGRMAGPVLGGLVVDFYNIEILFFAILILLLSPFVSTYLFDRRIHTERKATQIKVQEER